VRAQRRQSPLPFIFSQPHFFTHFLSPYFYAGGQHNQGKPSPQVKITNGGSAYVI
jgi:hypothetical protein